MLFEDVFLYSKIINISSFVDVDVATLFLTVIFWKLQLLIFTVNSVYFLRMFCPNIYITFKKLF